MNRREVMIGAALTGRAGGSHVHRARRKIQQGRNPAHGEQPKQRDDEGVGVGEQDGNGSFSARQPGKSATQNKAAGNDAAEGERVALNVLQNFSAAAMD